MLVNYTYSLFILYVVLHVFFAVFLVMFFVIVFIGFIFCVKRRCLALFKKSPVVMYNDICWLLKGR